MEHLFSPSYGDLYEDRQQPREGEYLQLGEERWNISRTNRTVLCSASSVVERIGSKSPVVWGIIGQEREDRMNRHFNDKTGRKKKKTGLESYTDEQLLKVALEKFEDPIGAVRDILDPEHKNIVKSDLRVAPSRPKEPTKGLFRVIYVTTQDQGNKSKIKSVKIEATDGYDAKFQFDSFIVDKKFKSTTRVIGVECLYVPRSIKNEFLREFNMENLSGVMTPLVEQAWVTLIDKLEVFEDEKPDPDISDFINDE